jgi:ribosomal protein S12 methylthiotransferase
LLKKYHLISLGCPKNLIDSEIFSFLTEEAKYLPTEDSTKADLIIINTCGFIVSAKEEGIETILEAIRMKEEGICQTLIVTGCLVKRYFDELLTEFPEIDFLINLKDFTKFAQVLGLKDFAYNRKLMTPKHYAYLRISDGCNNNCTYCAIPLIRGKLTSIPMEDVVEEAKRLANQGVKELIITAQDTSQYGKDIYPEGKLIQLLKKISQVPGIQWIRLLYLHPAHLTHQLIDEIAEIPKILPYFDIPFQHISDKILRSMNRKKFSEHINDILDYLSKRIPNSMIRTTFIVGFPGEDRQDYEEIKRFIKERRFARLGVFIYSPEEDTPAYAFTDQVPKKTATNRYNKLMQIQQDISADIMESFIGREIECIIDKLAEDDEYDYEGRSWFDAPDVDGMVFLTDNKALGKIGDIVKVKITDAWEYDLIGEVTQVLSSN